MDSRDLSVSAALGALNVTVALAFGLVLQGDRWIVPLVVVALVPHAVGVAARALGRGHPGYEIGVSALIVVAAAVLATGPSPDDVLDSIQQGFDLLEGAAPIPATNGVILIAAGVVWAAGTIADQVVFHHDGSVGAVAPGVVVMIGFASTDTTSDLWLPISAFAVAAIVFLALEHRRLLERQRTWIGSTPTTRDAVRLLGGGLVIGVLAVALSVGAAVALIDSDRPLVDFGEILAEGDDPTSYKTDVPPLLNVGDELRQPEITKLFSVRADRPAYWRIVALDQYSSRDGGQWTLQAGEDEVASSLGDSVPADALFQQYEITDALSERWIPAAYRAVEIDGVDLGLVVPSSATLVTDEPTIAGSRYTVRSAVPPGAADINRAAAAAAPPDDVLQYTELPDDVPPIIRDTAQNVAGSLPDALSKAEALTAFFRDPSWVYDPDFVAGDDVAAIDLFMRERRGFCVQYATAYALMARALGIPARIGVGYTPGTLDEASGTYVVTNQDAHAWPELYFTGTGWATPYDPTPPGNDTQPGGSDLPGAAATQPTVPSTTPTTAAPPQSAPPSSPPATAGPTGSTPNQVPEDDGGVSIDTSATDDPEPVLPVVALLAIVIVLLLAPIVGVLASKHRRRARRRSNPDPAVAIAGAWREALDTLAEHRVVASAADTPMETAARVASDNDATWRPMSSLASTYSAARYAPDLPSHDDVVAAWRDVDDLRDALDRDLGPFARLRTRLSLRRARRAVLEPEAAHDHEVERELEREREPELV